MTNSLSYSANRNGGDTKKGEPNNPQHEKSNDDQSGKNHSDGQQGINEEEHKGSLHSSKHDSHEESSDKDKQGSPQASNDEGKQTKIIEHEGHSPKHVLAASPRQGAMNSSPKTKMPKQQGRQPKNETNSKSPKEGAW